MGGVGHAITLPFGPDLESFRRRPDRFNSIPTPPPRRPVSFARSRRDASSGRAQYGTGNMPQVLDNMRPRRFVPTAKPVKSLTTWEDPVAELRACPRWRHPARLGVAIAIAIAACLTTAVTAQATCSLTNFTLTKYPGTSANVWAYSAWDPGAHWFQLETQDNANFDGVDYCADAWWDWHFQEL